MSAIRFNIKLSDRLTLNIWILTTKDGNMTSWYIWKYDVKCNFDIVVLHIFFYYLNLIKIQEIKKWIPWSKKNGMVFECWACVKKTFVDMEVQICYWFHDYYVHWIFHQKLKYEISLTKFVQSWTSMNKLNTKLLKYIIYFWSILKD